MARHRFPKPLIGVRFPSPLLTKSMPTFVIASHAIIKHEDKVLVTRRAVSDKYMSGFWDFPGGTLKIGETPVENIVREVQEETGLAVKILGLDHVFTNLEQAAEIQFFQILFNCEYIGGEITLSATEHDEYRWVTLTELEDMQLIHFVEDWMLRQK